ncbi:uncharacterized protein LOC102801860 [Saccoglossus kowalevskii]|uniref:Uncharacterized protein LOC102801860 n=1 Tax=Saccoglossus kowalevskii TaxID=10224 RepID=A0ABM0N1G1_SACKO|nr:PREDICTED: uncharacterized protein LOC102801860 [Saccoglossus kowalevskii]
MFMFDAMASKALLKKKKESGDQLRLLESGLAVPPKEVKRHPVENCPTFWVQYLGKMPAKGEFGKEFVTEPVETLCKLREKQKLPKTALTISPKGFYFMDCHGPFGKEKHVIIPIHLVCYGIADAQYPRVFAVITRTDSDPDSSLFECHAFLCEKRKIAQLITYWLLRTLLRVFENLQRKRHHRKRRERRRLESQMRLNSSGSETTSSKSSAELNPQSHPSSEYVYSVILEGSGEQGASVRISRDRRRTPAYFAKDVSRGQLEAGLEASNSPTGEPPVEPEPSMFDAVPKAHVVRPLRYVSGATSEIDEINNPRYFKFRKKSQPRTPIYERTFSMDCDAMSTIASRSSGGSGSFSESSACDSSISDNSTGSNGEKDFVFIRMLQDEISSLDIETETKESDANRTSKQIAHDLGVSSRLTDKDVHRRIQDWLRLTLKPDDDEERCEKQRTRTPNEPTEVKVLASTGDYF